MNRSIIRPCWGRFCRQRTFIPGVFVAAFLLTLACAPLVAQTGQITGRVTDPSGGVVPGATLTITETSTADKRIVQSNSEGYYTVPSLLPGPYSIAAEHPGFKSVLRTGVQLEVGQDLRIDLPLEVGGANETVTVSAEAPLLETGTSSAGQVISSRDIVQLPLLGRDAYALGELMPGVRGSIGMNNLPVDVISTSSISVNGAPATANDFLLDGAPNSSPAQNQPVIYPIADSVQEFKVETSNVSAEFGRAAGGIYNVVTKAGTNDFHFSVYEFYRNGTLTANDWFSKAAGQPGPALSFNQFGGVLGGPVTIPKLYNGHNKTFFFIGTELVRFTQGNSFTATVPNPSELTGNFSQDKDSAGEPITIYNPFSTRRNPNGSGYIRDPFPGNIIPANLLNPISVKMASYLPKPNVTGVGGASANNYILAAANNIQENQYTVRLDQDFSANTRMFARYSYNDTPYIRANPYGPGNLGAPGFGAQDFNRQNAVLEGDRVFSPTFIGTIRTSFARLGNVRGPISQGFDITTLGFPAGLAQEIGPPAAFPVSTITGYGVSSSVANSAQSNPLGETGSIRAFTNTYALQANITKILREHELKTGIDFRVLQANIFQTNDNSTNFNYTPAFTQGPNATQPSATAGDALASFLLGTPQTGGVQPSPALALETKYYSAFIEDNWRVSSRLTLNLGIRYDFETPKTERHNRLTNFNPNATVPLSTPGLNLHGALTFVGVDGNSRYQSTAYPAQFSPRLGFAWQAQPTTAVRGGGGIFYSTVWGAGGVAPTSYGISGFTTATDMVTTIDGVTPFDQVTNPYPSGLNQASGSSLGAATLLGQGVSFTERNLKTPYTIQWNMDVQQLLPHAWILDIGYVGTHSLHESGGLALNQLPDSALALGSALLKQVPNPFRGQILTGALAQATVSQAQLLRPYPQYTAVTSDQATWAEARYNSLQVKLEKRFTNNFNFLSAYTFSKMLDQITGGFSGETLGGGSIQDYNNLKAELSPSSIDQTHRLVSGMLYQLPIFREQHGLRGHVFGGLEISVLTSFISGSPLGITSASNGTFSQGGGQRPNWNGQRPSLSHHTTARWFNTSVFSTPQAFHFGNAPRTFNNLRSDWIRNIDLSLHKNVQLAGHLNLQLRMDAFNMDNTPTFQPPNTSFGSKQFGVVSAQANEPRTIQLAVKLLY